MKVATVLVTVVSLASTAFANGCFYCSQRIGGVVCTTPGSGTASHGCDWCCDTETECVVLIKNGICK
ncbi:hypothetical protein CSHISOI_06579 [Colletotrichum shisoi]|uniref:Secreted protein n=1 Tax=Colletotrichum shisoi TaxID=2078593 RepID=A0A5Q4BQ37_9PEZI|nr:hypothetical protein CSHISOI_06579 [Colletotrichum shisoi]